MKLLDVVNKILAKAKEYKAEAELAYSLSELKEPDDYFTYVFTLKGKPLEQAKFLESRQTQYIFNKIVNLLKKYGYTFDDVVADETAKKIFSGNDILNLALTHYRSKAPAAQTSTTSSRPMAAPQTNASASYVDPILLATNDIISQQHKLQADALIQAEGDLTLKDIFFSMIVRHFFKRRGFSLRDVLSHSEAKKMFVENSPLAISLRIYEALFLSIESSNTFPKKDILETALQLHKSRALLYSLAHSIFPKPESATYNFFKKLVDIYLSLTNVTIYDIVNKPEARHIFKSSSLLSPIIENIYPTQVRSEQPTPSHAAAHEPNPTAVAFAKKHARANIGFFTQLDLKTETPFDDLKQARKEIILALHPDKHPGVEFTTEQKNKRAFSNDLGQLLNEGAEALEDYKNLYKKLRK